MQNCFREYPEIYGSELDANDEDDMSASAQPQSSEEETPRPQSQYSSSSETSKPTGSENRNPIYDARGDMSSTEEVLEKEKSQEEKKSQEEVKGKTDTERANAAKKQVQAQQPVSESERLVPKAAHDGEERGTGVLGKK